MSKFNRLKTPPTQKQQIFTILWLSFLIAGAATGVFFTLLDPIEISACVDLPELSRTGAYSVGFLLFWALTSGTCFLSQFFLSVEKLE